MRTWALGVAALLASLVSMPSAFGETVTVTANGIGVGVSGLSVHVNNVGGTDYAGTYKWTVSGAGDVGGNTVGPVGTQFSTFCIQVGQSFSGGSPYTFSVASINSNAPAGGVDGGYIDPTAAGQVQLLTDRYFGLVGSAGSQSINSITYTAGQVAAAFQLAVWEIEYDGGSGKNSRGSFAPESFPGSNYFTTGNMTASAANGSSGAAAIGLAGYFLDNFTTGTSGVDTTYSSWVLKNDCAQDQFLGVPNVKAVPLPAALPMGVILLAGLGIARRVCRKAYN